MRTNMADRDLSLRHAVATLAYRAAKVLRDAPADFSAYRPGATSRSAGEILAHLLDWALSIAQGNYLGSDAKLHAPVRGENYYIADIEIGHIDAGQLPEAAEFD
jgi:hypothetical protein